MSDDASFSHFPSSYTDKNSRKSHFVAIFFIIIFVVIIILVGLYFLGASKTGTLQPVTIPKPTATPAINPSPSPTPVALDRSKLEIAVLNGSGVAGAAKGISSLLEELGYSVKKVGNAEKFDYKNVTINITKEKSDYLELLKKDLAGKATSIETNIDDDITVDAEVIVGK